MDIEFDQARLMDVVEFLRHEQPAYVMRVDGVAVAIGGILMRNNEWWGFFEVKGRPPAAAARKMLRFLRKALQSYGQTIKVQCGKERYQRAPLLLRYLGFEPTGDIDNGCEVWIWKP